MKLACPVLLLSVFLVTCQAAAVSLPANISSLTDNSGTNEPDPRFKIVPQLEAPLLPPDAVLLNMLYFMGLAALHVPTDHLIPRTYSAPGYRNVEIATFAFTESRFLLWGVYLAAIYMVENSRFQNMVIELLWDGLFVGRMKIAAKSLLTLPGHDGEGNLVSGIDGNQTTSTNTSSLSSETTPSSNNPLSKFETEYIDSWTANTNESSPSSTNLGVDSLTVSIFSVEFEPLTRAKKVSRSDVFLSTFVALLEAANYLPQEGIGSITAISRLSEVFIHVYHPRSGCLYGQAIRVLTYVPRYMVEHPISGYKESIFQAKMDDVDICRGSLLKRLV